MDKDTDKEKYIQQEIFKLLHSQTTVLILLAVFLALSFCIVDYLVTPENFNKFLVYRLIWGFILIAFYFLNNKYKRTKYFS